MALVTKPNLIRWYSQTSDTPFPRPVNDCRQTTLMTYIGEVTQFYVNPLNGDWNINWSGAVLTMETRAGANVSAAITSALSIDSISSDKKTIFGGITCPNVAFGYYRWKIQHPSLTLRSNWVQVVSQEQAKAESIYVRYRNDRSLGGIRWAWIDDGFVQQARIPAVLVNPDIASEDSSYREVTTGKPKFYNTSARRLLNFRTEYIDDDFYEGIAAMLLHNTLFLNGQPVVRSGGPARSAGRGVLSPMTFTVEDLTYDEPLVP